MYTIITRGIHEGCILFWVMYALICLSLLSGCCHIYQQLASSVEQKRIEAFMLLRRDPSYPKALRLLHLSAMDRPYIAVGLLCFVIHSMARLLWAVLYGELIDAVYHGDSPEIHKILLKFIAVILFQGIFDIIGAFCLELAASKLGTRLQRLTFSLLVEQDIGFFDKSKTGKLMTILESNVGDVQNILTWDLGDTFEGVVTSLVLLAYMWATTWEMALVFSCAVVVPLCIICINAFMVEKMNQDLKELEGEQGQVANEQLGSMKTVKSFGAEEHSKRLYFSSTEGTYFQQRKIAIFEAVMNGFAMDLGWPAVILACFWVGSPLTVENKDFRVDFVSFTIIANQAINQLEKSFETVPQFAKAIGASCKIFTIFDNEASVPYTGGRRLQELKGHIEIKGLDFGYEKAKDDKETGVKLEKELVFKNLELKIEAGQHVALVGPSGSGKTTLFALLARFYNPLEGSISYDGVPLSKLDPQWLRQQVGMVMQEPVLFSGTVSDNIIFDQVGVTQEQVEAAAKLANAHEFIMAKSGGYDSMLGEKGISLSGGEKQRVAIARAILRSPKILLLDEATSALDNESETLVQQALYRLTEGKTMLVIAHRLSTITGCDGVAIFNQETSSIDLQMGKAAVSDYIRNHHVEEGELPVGWDASLTPVMEELQSKLNGLGLEPEQMELATKELLKRMNQETASAHHGGQDSESSSGDSGSSGSSSDSD